MSLLPIWAFGSVLLWQFTARVPAALAPPMWVPQALTAGFILATIWITWLDSRLFPSPLIRTWSVIKFRWAGCALLAGIGFSIIGSEFGNIGDGLVNDPVPLADAPPMVLTPLLSALLASVIYPICFIWILLGVSQRALLLWVSPWTTILMVSVLATLGSPIGRIGQLAFIMGLPAWIYIRTGSIGLAAIAYFPSNSMALLDYFNLKPGILGYDLVETEGRLMQPLWFNLLGAALMALGLGPLLQEEVLQNEDDE